MRTIGADDDRAGTNRARIAPEIRGSRVPKRIYSRVDLFAADDDGRATFEISHRRAFVTNIRIARMASDVHPRIKSTCVPTLPLV